MVRDTEAISFRKESPMRSIRYLIVTPCLLVAATLLGGCDGCEKTLAPLVLTIDADPTGGRAPLPVSFVLTVQGDEGESGLEYEWDFDDASDLVVDQEPDHVFAAGGTYAVTLNVTRTEDGHTALGTVTVLVEPDSEPTVTVAANPDMGLEPLTVQFESFVTGGDGAIAYTWEFDDGDSSSLPNPQHVYASAGAYDATVTVIDEDGDTEAATVSVAVGSDEQPAPTATATPDTGQVPLSVDFTCAVVGGNDPITFSWDFGDGGNSTLADVTHTYTTPGVYVATCVVTDANGSSDSDSVTITVVSNNAPTAVASASPVNGDVPLAVSFVGTGIGGDGTLTYDWSFGDGNTSPLQNPVNTYNATGTFGAILTVTDGDGDFDVDTVTITVNPVVPGNLPPIADAAILAGSCAVPGATLVQVDASASSDPEAAPLTYDWVFVSLPPGSSAAFNNPAVVAPTFVPDLAGTYTLRVFVSDGTNNVASNVVSITASGPTVIAFAAMMPGDGQVATVNGPIPNPMVVNVANSCGAPVPGYAIDWTGTNAVPDVAATSTGAGGDASNTATAGPLVGGASVTATVAGTTLSVTFNHTVEAAPPAFLLLDQPGMTVVPGPMTLTVDVLDQFGSPSTTTPVTFDLCVVLGNATFQMVGGPACEIGVSTSGGTATFDVFDQVAETVAFELSNVSLVIPAGTKINVFFDDLDSGDDGMWGTAATGSVEDWELGMPMVVGPPSAFSGNDVWGTDLNSDYDFSLMFMGTDTTALSRLIDFTALLPLGAPAPLEVVLTEMEYFDMVRDDTGCPAAGGMISLSACGAGGCLTPPDRGFDTLDCAWGPGNTDASGGWIEVAYDLTPSAPGIADLVWTLVRGDSSTTAAGWYLDDISVDVFLQWVPGTFLPGPPAILNPTLVGTVPLVTTCYDAEVLTDVTDTFGNIVPGTLLDWSVDLSATFNGFFAGVDYTPAGATASIEADAAGEAGLFVTDTVAETVSISVEVSGDPTTAVSTPATFLPMGAEICDDGADNDCDGDYDCTDPDCALVFPCPGAYPVAFAPDGAGGTTVAVGDDQTSGLIPMGFDFVFFGTTYSAVNISSNGFIGFDAGMSQGCCSGLPIPAFDSIDNIVAAAWTDLFPPGGGSITYEMRGTAPARRFVITFDMLPFFPEIGTNRVTTQIILYEGSNYIEVHTTNQDVWADGIHLTTQGVENAAGDTAYFIPGRVAADYSLTDDAVLFITN